MDIPELRIGHLSAGVPIIQGGMGVGISLSGLSSAVANCGGIGVISTACIGMNEPDFRRHTKEANRRALTTEIRKAREQTDGIIGLNIMIALTDHNEHIEVALDEDVDIVFLGAGLPLRFSDAVPPRRLRETRTLFVPIVSSGRAAELVFNHWARKFGRIPDGVVVEGPKAGGHLGFKREQIEDPTFSLERIFPGVLDAVRPFEDRFDRPVPVVAAGGIYTGEDIAKFLEMGASGVQLGTRFVATHECDADLRFKEAFVRARRKDMVVIDSPVGLPGRAIRNAYLDDVATGKKKPYRCPWKCLRSCPFKDAPYCIASALIHAKTGELQHGFPFAGANAYRVKEIVSVRELMGTLVDEYASAARARLPVADCV